LIRLRVRTLVAIASIGWSCRASANGDLCSSVAFRDAFVEGQSAVDWPSVGSKLVKFGDAAVPCLEAIARDEVERIAITRCDANPRKCRAWAVLALSAIGTAKAKSVLLGLLDHKSDPVEIVQVIGGLTSLRVRDARPAIRRRLEHDSAYVRAHAILALGTLGDSRDVDAMIAATMSLPRNNLSEAMRGLELTGDARIVGALEDLARKFPDPVMQGEITRIIERIRAGKAIRPDEKETKR